jgi:HEAT repeats
VIATQVAVAVLLTGAYGYLLSTVLVRARRRRRAERPIARARAGVARLAAGESLGSGARAALARLPIQVQVRLIAGLSSQLAGDGGVRLAELAAGAGVVTAAERLCRDRRGVRRVRGLRVLTQVGAASAVAPALLDDRDPEVRAAAATWAAGHPSPELGARLVTMLEDEWPYCRFAAKDALLRMGHDAVAPLARRLREDPDGRVEDALEVAAGLADPALLPAALGAASDESTRRRVLAAEAFTAIGGAEAAAVLERMLADPDPAVRAAAAGGLGHLGHWPAAVALAAALRDPSWDVRRGAGLALSALGAPGELLLREALTDQDRFAADMARQILELPRARTIGAAA